MGGKGGNINSAFSENPVSREGRHQFTSASEAIVLLVNEEPLPLLLCADGLYGPLEPGRDPPLMLLLFGEGGVWGLNC